MQNSEFRIRSVSVGTFLSRTYRVAALAAAIVWAGVAFIDASQTSTGSQRAALAPGEITSALQQYCVTCHSDRLKTGGVTLEGVDAADPGRHADVLEKAARKLLVGAMPPIGAPRPPAEALQRLTVGLESALDEAAAARPSNPGRAILRRLNRTEYANAVRDLLDLRVDVSSMLPFDNSSYGFDNIADVLGMSPVLMEQYLTAARRISALAVGDPVEIITTADTYRAKPDLSQDRHIEGLPMGTRGGVVVDRVFPLDAEYTFKVNLLQATLNNVVGLEFPHTVVLTVDGQEVHRATIGGRDDLVMSYANSQGAAEKLEARLVTRERITAGPHRIGATFVEKSAALRNGVLQPFLRTTFEPVNYTGQPHIEALVVTGPFSDTGPGDTPSRTRVFVCTPGRQFDETACATRILSKLAERAYRRPVTPEDTRTLLKFFRMGREDGSFDAGIEMGLRRILASPDFVLRVERDPAGLRPGAVRPVTDLELASRLSFFLWSSLPDAELLRVAGARRLRQPEVLERQVRRMLADERAKALVENFGGQWLYLRNLRNIAPNPREFSDFDDNLRAAMLREMELFLESIIREDRPVTDLMTAGDTFLNERLARHYGVPGIYGDWFRRVTLQQPERHGLLGKGAILTVTSLATRTSPVVRGKWILENIVGTPPPPPPPDVPALDENLPGQKPRTLRERTETHRRNPPCATCHRVMDPIGFALENYDAVGQWRTKDAGSPIDTTGQLMDGAPLDGPVSLRQALSRNPEVFVRTMTEKLMIYALGRGLEAQDMPVLRAVTRAAAANDYGFSSLVMGVVTSVPFQMKTVASAEAAVASGR